MSVIVSVANGSTVTMGADTAVGNVSSNEMFSLQWPKKIVRIGDDYLIGYCGSLRTGQTLLRTSFPEPKGDLLDHMLNRFAPVLADAIRSDKESMGLVWTTENVDQRESRRCIVVGVRGRLFFFSADLSIVLFDGSCSAIGDSRSYALGALHASNDSDLKPEERVLAALKAAACYSPSVREPFQIETLASSYASPSPAQIYGG